MFRLTEISCQEQYVELKLEGEFDRPALQDLFAAIAAYRKRGLNKGHLFVDHSLAIYPSIPRILQQQLDEDFEIVFFSDSAYLRQILANDGLTARAI